MKQALNGIQTNRRGKPQVLSVEKAVRDRYARGAARREEALCCPVSYAGEYLKVLPKEILEKDYGCGDPSPFVRKGDVVLDLGSGAGKICYIASQIVGAEGRVIGVDFNPAMLSLANKYRKSIAAKIGWANVEFKRGRIQDLRTDFDTLTKKIKKKPLRTIEAYAAFEESAKRSGQIKPMIADHSIDVIVSNCVLNLVDSDQKRALFGEMHRVLKKGGRVAISDIVADEDVPMDLQKDPELWSGCISGAFQEKAFLKAFEEAGFYGISIVKRDELPWRVERGIEFRSVTVTAYKGKEGACLERNQAVIYRGPWKEVLDDDAHVLKRGVRTAVCGKTFDIYAKEPYRNEFYFLSPKKEIPLTAAKPFDCAADAERHPRETKGMRYQKPAGAPVSGSSGGCC